MARILVVDDDEGVRSVVHRLLTVHDHHVDTANDGAAGVDQLQKASYDLLLIDRNMPKLSGPEAVSIIRSSPKFDRMKILMMTVASLTKEVDDAFKRGIDDYIVKPFEMEQLLEKVRKMLAEK